MDGTGEALIDVGAEGLEERLIGVAEVRLTFKWWAGEVGDSMLTEGGSDLWVNIDMGRCLVGVGCLFLS